MVFEKKYDDDVKRRSVARVLERREAEPGNRAVLREVAEEFEVGEQSLRVWVRRADAAASRDTIVQATTLRAVGDSDSFDGEVRGGQTRVRGRASLLARVQELEAEVEMLRADNAVLKRATAIFAAELKQQD